MRITNHVTQTSIKRDLGASLDGELDFRSPKCQRVVADWRTGGIDEHFAASADFEDSD